MFHCQSPEAPDTAEGALLAELFNRFSLTEMPWQLPDLRVAPLAGPLSRRVTDRSHAQPSVS